MSKFFSTLLDWSEVWATAIPVLVWLFIKFKQRILKPVLIYLWCALILYLLIDLAYLQIFKSNNLIYNILSIIRLLLFMQFFSLLDIPANKYIKKIIIAIVLLVLAVLIVFEDIIDFNSQIFTAEALVLIGFCIVYFLRRMRSDELSTEFDSSLYVVTGLAIYEAVCFPIFLFYDTLMHKSEDYATNIWDVHNIAYIVFCLFIARAFYGSSRYTGK